MKINVSKAKELKTIKGFGASSCWWSTHVPFDKAEEIIDLLYSDDGLKMNIYRYNVGGGWKDGNFRIANPWRKIESFMLDDGSFDYSKDAKAVNVMDKALATGNVDTLIFFANSPHYSHTVTKQTSGGFTEHFSNLDRAHYDDFARYFIDIAEHFTQEGYPVKYISPINEPQWKWGGGHVWQEGCHYEPDEVRDCFLAFAKELERRNSSLLLYGPESGAPDDHTKEYYELLSAEPLIMKYLDTFAYHSYHVDNDVKVKTDFGKWAQENVKTPRLDMSEWCELPCKNDTKSIESALIMTRIIGEDLIYSMADSWTAWVCANQFAIRDGKNYSDGLLSATNDWSEYEIAMRYYAMAHYSKYIPIGSTSLDIGYQTSRGLSVFAFKTPAGNTVIVSANFSNAKRVIEPDIKFESARVITTTKASQLSEEIADKITVPPMSIVTAII